MTNDPFRTSRAGLVLSYCGMAVLGMGAAWALAADPPRDARGNDKSDPQKGATRQQAGSSRDQKDDAQGRQGNADKGRRRHGMGVQLESKNNQLVVSRIDEGSPAAQAGLRQNDRIVSVDGYSFNRMGSLNAYLAGQGARLVPIVFERDGQQYTAYVNNVPFEGGAWLGVYLEENDENTNGARITRVYPAGPAARAGLSTGDTVKQVGGQNIAGSAELIGMVQQMQPNTRIELTVTRNDRELKIPVVLASRNNYVYQDFAFNEDRSANGQTYQSQSYENSSNDDDADIHPEAMRLEHDRRNAEQHQRIEDEIRQLKEEIAKLRQELQSRK